MAVRSGAPVGNVVALVVFVITTIALLILSIVFFRGQTLANEAKSTAETDLDKYVKSSERGMDMFTNYEAAASQNRQSVAMYLHTQMQEVMSLADGSPSTTVPDLKARLNRQGVADGTSMRSALTDRDRQINTLGVENDDLRAQVSSARDATADAEARATAAREAHQREIDALTAQIKEYADAAEDYKQQVYDTVTTLKDMEETLRGRYQSTISDLESQNDQYQQERVNLLDRIHELQTRLDHDRIKPHAPELLVDARIIDVTGDGQVFIDRGRDNRIVLGMTFEVYDSPASIRVNPNTGMLPRGKASLQVLKVGPTTSTCRITRSIPGRPAIRGDVLANAVYDPDYKFKFLVHGVFDVDGDGRPSAAEAEYLRDMIIRWGGEVITGMDLPGDLDFLVLGIRPPLPPDLPQNATEIQLRDWTNKHLAREQYDTLFQQASDAQIPILNANRFFILIGHTDR